jgi:TadE-like protein
MRNNSRGQALVEFTIILPLLIVLVLGVVEVSYALLDQHIVTKLTREGSNLISRNTTLGDAASAMKAMETRPVIIGEGSRLIFSVVRNIPTIGANNYNKAILAQRYAYGDLAKSSAIKTAGSGSFGGAPDYSAANPDNNTSLQVTNLPVTMSLGSTIYVTELYATHPTITPFANFGIQVPQTLYSIAYF